MSTDQPSTNPDDYPSGYLAEYHGETLIATSVVFIVLEIVVFGLRFYTRRMKKAPVGLDDWCLWPALVINVILCIEGAALIPAAGVGYHFVAVKLYSPKKLIRWGKGILACVWLWALAVALPKLSILGFYLRFLTGPVERKITLLTMSIVLATFFATGFAATFQCSPVAYQWNKSIAGGRCIDVLALYRWMSFPNIVTDVVGLVLPLPMIWGLHITREQRLGITIMFLTGSAGIISSVLRFIIFFKHDAFKDNTWTSVELLKWTDIEPGIYFVAACMPSLRPIIQMLWKNTVSAMVSRSKDATSEERRSEPGIQLSGLSLVRDSDRSGFERIVTPNHADKVPQPRIGRLTTNNVPNGSIAVKQEIWLENHVI